ncbi:MAG: helix-turn-helix domain-containing protein, partial [Acidobacteriota bacterium]|nr:helix-turn-helix domain-containing protein [Acidobacteriota bacterium]
SKTYLEALEQERFDVLPAPVFAKGFLREYAKYVGLDPDEVINSYLSAVREDGAEAGGAAASPPPRSSFEWTLGILLAAALLVLVGVIGLAGFWAERSQRRASGAGESAAGETAAGEAARAPEVAPAVRPGADEPRAPVAEPPAPVARPALPPAPLVVTLDFTEDCWVEASVDGRRRLSELHVQGESLKIDAERRVELTLGNPSGVAVEVNGAPYPLPEYRPGRVARDIAIDLEDVE